MLPGKLYGGKCFVSWAGKEVALDVFRVLRSGGAPYSWHSNDSLVKLADAFKGGGEEGHPAYICASSHGGSLHSGRVSEDGNPSLLAYDPSRTLR